MRVGVPLLFFLLLLWASDGQTQTATASGYTYTKTTSFTTPETTSSTTTTETTSFTTPETTSSTPTETTSSTTTTETTSSTPTETTSSTTTTGTTSSTATGTTSFTATETTSSTTTTETTRSTTTTETTSSTTTESSVSCSGINCAADEECKIDGGVPGCRCNDSAVVINDSANLTTLHQPQVTCGLDNIRVTFSKCELEKLGYDTSSISLQDRSCRGVIDRREKSYITLVTRPQNGYCGALMRNTGNEILYQNTAYVAGKNDGVIIKEEQPIIFNCPYPLNMDIHLISALNPLIVREPIIVNGIRNYTLALGLFQDTQFSNPYTGREIQISTKTTLYVGVMAIGSSGSSPFVLIMKNCFATPTPNINGIRYDIIANQCPNRNDPTISVLENGVSLKGRFSIQMFKFVSGPQVYLHCQVSLCDSINSDCSAHCSQRSSSARLDETTDISIGPILNYDAVQSGGGSSAPPVKLLILLAIVILVLLFQRDH